MKYSVILFDVGDTLIELSPNIADIYSERMVSMGIVVSDAQKRSMGNQIETVSRAQIRNEVNGAPRMSDEDFEMMLAKEMLKFVCPTSTKEDIDRQLGHLIKTPLRKQELVLISNVIKVLSELKERSYRLGIVSNHKKWLPDLLAKLGILRYFECIVVSEIVGYEKPDVRIMEIALNKLAVSAEDCLYVGDHPYDVYCAKKAKIDCVWIAPKEEELDIPDYQEDYRISTIVELLDVLPNA